MDIKNNQVTLYTAQSPKVLKPLTENNIYYPKLEFIKEKYEDTSESFLYAYKWFKNNSEKIVNQYVHSESAIWTFCHKEYVGRYPNSIILTLSVPISEVIFFRMSDWNKILNYKFIGSSEKEEIVFSERLKNAGIEYEGDIFEKPYYPIFKNEIIKSWSNIFKYDSLVKNNKLSDFLDLQGAIWVIKNHWIEDIEHI